MPNSSARSTAFSLFSLLWQDLSGTLKLYVAYSQERVPDRQPKSYIVQYQASRQSTCTVTKQWIRKEIFKLLLETIVRKTAYFLPQLQLSTTTKQLARLAALCTLVCLTVKTYTNHYRYKQGYLRPLNIVQPHWDWLARGVSPQPACMASNKCAKFIFWMLWILEFNKPDPSRTSGFPSVTALVKSLPRYSKSHCQFTNLCCWVFKMIGKIQLKEKTISKAAITFVIA